MSDRQGSVALLERHGVATRSSAGTSVELVEDIVLGEDDDILIVEVPDDLLDTDNAFLSEGTEPVELIDPDEDSLTDNAGVDELTDDDSDILVEGSGLPGGFSGTFLPLTPIGTVVPVMRLGVLRSDPDDD